MSFTFDALATGAARLAGSKAAFILAVLSILIWLATGPLFGFGDSWQLVINTGTTIVTFLMVFLIQYSQNKDSKAVHLKLNEIIVASPAKNAVLCIERLDDAHITELYRRYETLQQKKTGGEH